MRFRIHHPLFAGFLAVVVLLTTATLILAGSALRERLVELRRAELGRELALAARVLEAEPELDADSAAELITDRIGYRTTVIAEDGTVLGDSDVARRRLAAVENHADRPEVRAALAGGTGFSSRESETVGASLLYAARTVRWRGDRVVLRIAASMEEIEASVGAVRRAVAWAGLLATVGALVASYLLSRLLAVPLVALAERARALGRGDYSRRAPRNRSIAELDDLSAAFNRLTDELGDRIAELRGERDEMSALIETMAEGVVALTADARLLRSNRAAAELLDLPAGTPPYAPVGTLVRHPELRNLLEEAVVDPFRSRDLTLRGRHMIVAARALDRGGAVVTFLDVTEVRRLEEVRRDFVANASHELKTPLTTIRGFAETLLEDEPPPELRTEFLGSIRRNTLRLQHLVDDLLDLSRLESGGWIARRGPVDPARVARSAWSETLEQTGGEELDFTIEGRAVEGRAVADADEEGLRRIFLNLFDNAVRHTPAGGRVTVEVREREGEVEISVVDTGSGIPSEALPRVFERFFRGDPARARSEGGTGLGLAIVKHLVERMGGRITVESRLGHGSTFRFTLPSIDDGTGDGTDDGTGERTGGATGATGEVAG